MWCEENPCKRCGRMTRAGFLQVCNDDWPESKLPTPLGLGDYVESKSRKECRYLLDPTGDSVTLFGCGCPSSRKNGVQTAVFQCSLHGRCSPHPKGTHLSDASVQRCVTCPDNPAKR